MMLVFPLQKAPGHPGQRGRCCSTSTNSRVFGASSPAWCLASPRSCQPAPSWSPPMSTLRRSSAAGGNTLWRRAPSPSPSLKLSLKYLPSVPGGGRGSWGSVSRLVGAVMDLGVVHRVLCIYIFVYVHNYHSFIWYGNCLLSQSLFKEKRSDGPINFLLLV